MSNEKESVPVSSGTLTQKKILIFDLLHEGSENGMTLTELVQLTGED